MNAIEIRGLKKSFRGLYAVDGLDMTVPQGAIYGFIGENGSGKSTTEKLICGHLVPSGGKIRLFGKSYTDAGVRARVGALIENTGCFPQSTIYQNLMMQAINLNLKSPNAEIHRVLRIVRMDGEAGLKFKKCSLGMKQRVGIAMALLGDPALLILDEPINGLDADGMQLFAALRQHVRGGRRTDVRYAALLGLSRHRVRGSDPCARDDHDGRRRWRYGVYEHLADHRLRRRRHGGRDGRGDGRRGSRRGLESHSENDKSGIAKAQRGV